jgi:glycosyltransferase involved in cell wall biosynthesis
MTTSLPTDVERVGRPQIVWDGLGLAHPNSGVGVYGRNLCSSLNELGCQPSILAFTDEAIEFTAEEQRIKIQARQGTFFSKLERLKPFYPSVTYAAAKERWNNQSVIFHGLSNINLPVFARKRTGDRFVVTVHDLTPLNLEEITPLYLQYLTLLPGVIKRADKILTPSQWTKIQILERYGIGVSEKIEILGYGTTPSQTPMKEWSARSIDGLTISRGEGYKRLHFISEIASALSHRSFTVVTDALGAKSLQNSPRNLTVLQNVSNVELEELYSNSKILIHPSLYEGWCLPASDALARGLILLYCRGSGIDEVAGYGKKQVKAMKPDSPVDEWISAFDALVGKAPTGLDQLRLPSWLEIAQKTLKIYDSLL